MLKKMTSIVLGILLCMISAVECSEPYVTAHLMGQLGNQMFIIAAATSLALDHGVQATFPELLDEGDEPVFKLPYNYKHLFYRCQTKTPSKEIATIYREPRFCYDSIPFEPNMMLFGWFQSHKYFAHHRQEILNLFQPSEKILTHLQQTYSEIIQHPESVAIHFRSYLKEDPKQLVYPTYDASYYQAAMQCFSEDALFIVFSNDMPHCKEMFANLPGNFLFIEGENHFHDLYLMSLCKHQIICNSSFSWWGAYLNKNPDKKVIVPPQWFAETYVRDTSDLIPETWIRLDH